MLIKCYLNNKIFFSGYSCGYEVSEHCQKIYIKPALVYTNKYFFNILDCNVVYVRYINIKWYSSSILAVHVLQNFFSLGIFFCLPVSIKVMQVQLYFENTFFYNFGIVFKLSWA